jgi:hypothetical protein
MLSFDPVELTSLQITGQKWDVNPMVADFWLFSDAFIFKLNIDIAGL